MIVQQDFLRKLKDFGLNSYEAKLWTALLSRGISTAGELSDIAGVPRSRCYDVLESLEKKGFIITKLGKPIKYLAIEPVEVVDRVKKRVEQDAAQQVQMLEKVEGSEVLDELNSLYQQGIDLVEPSDLTGSIKGRNNIHNHIEHAIKNAKKEVLLVTSSQELMRKQDVLRKSLKKAKDRGVDIKIAAPLSKEVDGLVNELKKFATFKNVSNVTGRFMLVDNEFVTFMLMDGDKVHPSYDTAVWAKSPYFAATLQEMFKHSQK